MSGRAARRAARVGRRSAAAPTGWFGIVKPTFCWICEVYCGLVATVEDRRLTKLRPDRVVSADSKTIWISDGDVTETVMAVSNWNYDRSAELASRVSSSRQVRNQ